MTSAAHRVARLHWGCGQNPVAGWINSDVAFTEGVDLCGDIRDGLALADHSVDYAVSSHARTSTDPECSSHQTAHSVRTASSGSSPAPSLLSSRQSAA